MASSAKRIGEFLWYQRGRVTLLNVPVPWRLPYGGWFLAHGDAMGARVAGYRLAGSGYEQGQWRLVQRLLRRGQVFVDVGANQGFYTLLAARQVGPEGAVYAFEPAATERAKLQRNLALNKAANVVVEELALGSRTGRTEFHLVLAHQGSWSSRRPPAADVESRTVVVEVPMTTLDAYVADKGIARVDILKIDVEGGELDVLLGSQTVLRDLRPLVLCELEGQRTRQWGYEPERIYRQVEKLDYRWHEVDPTGLVRPADHSTPEDWHTLVAIPRERVADMPNPEASPC